MSDASGCNDILAFSTRLQRRLFEGWAAAVGRGWHSPREGGFRQPWEIGEEMVKLCLKLQGDLARSAMKAWDPRVNEHAPQVQGLDAGMNGPPTPERSPSGASVRGLARDRYGEAVPATHTLSDDETPGPAFRTWFSDGRSCVSPIGPRRAQESDAGR